MQDDLHGVILHDIQYSPWTRYIFMLPRGYFKTSMISIGYILWRIICNPNIRIALATANEEMGLAMISQQKAIIESEEFNAIFPEINPKGKPTRPDSRWGATSYTVYRDMISIGEPTLKLMTVGGATESQHFNLIVGNDLVNRINHKTETQRNEVKDFAHNFINLLDSRHSQIMIEGTTWHVDDLYSELLKNTNYRKFKLPLYYLDGSCTFPIKYTPEYIEQVKIDCGDPKVFAANYLLNPVCAERAFMSGEKFKRYKEVGLQDGTLGRETEDGVFSTPFIGTVVACDTATQEGSNMDAVAVMQRDTLGNWFVRYGKTENHDTVQRIKELENVDKWFDPIKIGIEVAAQSELASTVGDAQLRGYSRIDSKLYELRTYRKSKEYRIRAIQPLLRDGNIYWHEGIHDELIEQVRLYPEYSKDDFPDAVAYTIQMCRELFIAPRPYSGKAYMGKKNSYKRWMV